MHYRNLTYEEKELFNEIRAAIDEDKKVYLLAWAIGNNINIEKVLSVRYKESLLFQAIIKGKRNSSKSILNYIKGKPFEGRAYYALARDLFWTCSFFENDRSKKNTNSVIQFIKEQDILKDVLNGCVSYDVAEELSTKEGDTYLYSDKIIMRALNRQYKIEKAFMCCSFISLGIPLGLLTVIIGLMISPLEDIQTPLQSNLIPAGIYIILGSICAAAIIGIIICCVDSKFQSVEQVQNELKVERMQQEITGKEGKKEQCSAPLSVDNPTVEQLVPPPPPPGWQLWVTRGLECENPVQLGKAPF